MDPKIKVIYNHNCSVKNLANDRLRQQFTNKIIEVLPLHWIVGHHRKGIIYDSHQESHLAILITSRPKCPSHFFILWRRCFLLRCIFILRPYRLQPIYLYRTRRLCLTQIEGSQLCTMLRLTITWELLKKINSWEIVNLLAEYF